MLINPNYFYKNPWQCKNNFVNNLIVQEAGHLPSGRVSAPDTSCCNWPFSTLSRFHQCPQNVQIHESLTVGQIIHFSLQKEKKKTIKIKMDYSPFVVFENVPVWPPVLYHKQHPARRLHHDHWRNGRRCSLLPWLVLGTPEQPHPFERRVGKQEWPSMLMKG